MAFNIWISIQSDFGITMGELGRLSSETDSKLIASTLMALKDIVSIEASSGESQFMTGAVETSSFGTFAINVTDSSKLIMSYVISADQGSVKQGVVELAQSICTNLGKQLTAVSNISEMAINGQPIHRSTLIQSFLNACTIVKLEKKLPNDKRLVRKGIQSIVTELLADKKEFNELIKYILDPEWHKDDNNWILGFPTTKLKDKLFKGIAYHVVYLLSDERPMSFLYSPDPRSEHLRIYEVVKNEIDAMLLDPVKPVLKYLFVDVDEKLERSITNISSMDLHASETTLFNEFVRKAFLRALKDEPLLIFSEPNRAPIREKFNKKMPTLNIEHVGTILYRALEPRLEGVKPLYVKSFIDGFIEGMGQSSLHRSSMDLLTKFAQTFLESKDIVHQISILETLTNKRKKEITQMIAKDEVKQLNVTSVEDAVILTNAASNAIANTLATIITDQFLFDNGNDGDTVSKFVNFYRSKGWIIKTASILVDYFNILANLKFDVHLVTPRIDHVVASAVILNGYKIVIDGMNYQLDQKSDGVYIKGKDTDTKFSQFITKHPKLAIIKDKREIPIDFSNINAQNYINMLTSPDVLVQSSVIAASERLENLCIEHLTGWIDDGVLQIQSFANKLGNDNRVTVKSISSQRMILPKNKFNQVSLGSEISDILDEFTENVQDIWNKEIVKSWEVQLKEIKEKNEISKKVPKNLEKASQKFQKESEKLVREIRSNFDIFKKQILQYLKDHKSTLREALWPPYEEILAFKYDQQEMLPNMNTIRDEIKNYILTLESIQAEDLDSITLSISLTLFKKAPEAIFEPAWNEVITGKRSKNIKRAMNNAKSKREFEQYLQEQGQSFASEIYNSLGKIIERVNSIYIEKDGIVTSDGGKVSLHIGRIPVSKFARYDFVEEIIGFPGITYKRETNSWLISYEIFDTQISKGETPTIVTFEDAVRYVNRISFTEDLGKVFSALTRVMSLIEPEAAEKIQQTYSTIQDVIYPVQTFG
ncbi:MAG: hypothetical protein GPJ54_06885 [Candidatus Heimdallarchaeota archaeon]|nr:hypothetical protein [Candidatus Heimdallarchaeota archaeon]